MKGFIDPSAIEAALNIFIQDGQPFEIRVLHPRTGNGRRYAPKAIPGYFDSIPKAIEQLQALPFDGASGIYFVLNPINPALLSRGINKFLLRDPQATSDADIEKLQWLYIDIDSDRPSGVSASEEEKEAAWNLTWNVREFLEGEGWPAPLIADSGNGYHLLYRIDLDPREKETLHRVLEFLQQRFKEWPGANIDLTTWNPARICKLYGTVSAKGENAQDLGRPWRFSRVIEQPEEFEPVPGIKLRSLIPERPEHQDRRQYDSTPTWTEDRIRQIIQTQGWDVAKEKDFGGGTMFVLEQCPFDPSQTDRCAHIAVFPNGAADFKCKHDSCSHLRWRDFRDKFVPFEPSSRQPLPSHRYPEDRTDYSQEQEPDPAEEPEPEPEPTLNWMPYHLIEGPRDDDDEELIRHHYLLRRQALFILGSTGIGKSSLMMQMGIHFALGTSILGMEPVRPLKQMVFQGENHRYDLYAQRTGVINFYRMDRDEIERSGENFVFITDLILTGDGFLKQLNLGLESYQPDLVWLDPFQNVADVELSNPHQAKAFLARIMPVIYRHNCSAIFCHHTTKAGGQGENNNRTMSDYIYFGSGGHTLYDMARASLVLEEAKAGRPYFQLVAAKRGGKLKWKDEAGEPIYKRIIKHASDDSIYWEEVPLSEYEIIEAAETSQASVSAVEVAQMVSQNPSWNRSMLSGEIQRKFNVSRASAYRAIKSAESSSFIQDAGGGFICP